MSPDSGEPKFDRGYHEFTFSEETALPVTVEEDTSVAVDMGLATALSCVNMLMQARRELRIDFAPGVTATMLETIGVMLMRAAHTGNEPREEMFRHWLAAGPEMIENLIAQVETRHGRMLMPQDLASMFMGKPPGY